MRVEWYHGDFSDPEAVSGSSTTNFGRLTKGRFFVKCPVENFSKNYKKIIQKVIDFSIFGSYNRDSS